MMKLSLNDGKIALVAMIRHNDQCAKLGKPSGQYMVPFYVGHPGLGKTAMINAAAHETQRSARSLILAQYDPAEVGGFVYRDGTVMRKARPDYLPDGDDRTILFLDEFSQASQAVQNVAAQLVYDRCVGVHQLSPWSTVVAAGNLQTDRAGTAPLVRHFLNRVTMIGIDMPADDWLMHAAANDYHNTVIGFIAWRKSESLDQYDGKAESNATPRSWESVSKTMFLGLPAHIRRAVIAGYVGDAQAQLFGAFLKVMADLPDPLDIIRAPMKATIPTDQQVIYATVAALVGHADDKTVEPIIQYLDRLERKEFCVFAIRYMNTKDKKLINNKAITQWMARNAKLFA